MEGGGIHMLDLMINLTRQKPASVVSFANKFATKNTSFRYNDFHSCIFTFENGLIAKVTANFGCMHPHQHVVKIFGTDEHLFMTILVRGFLPRGRERQSSKYLHQKPKPIKKGLLINNLVETIREKKADSVAKREFDLMSGVIASEQALKTNKETEMTYRHMTAENLPNIDIPFGRPWIEQEEKDAVLEVLNGHILTHGKSCEDFEKAFQKLCWRWVCSYTSSCMASLHLSSLNLNIGKGDEVLVPALTHVATDHAIEIVEQSQCF